MNLPSVSTHRRKRHVTYTEKGEVYSFVNFERSHEYLLVMNIFDSWFTNLKNLKGILISMFTRKEQTLTCVFKTRTINDMCLQ